ncbi:MAG: DNA-deoxyinosine glycosylase [Firmicutes bacterium]|nr:DNA-deoxyinosine glycosylase [Bacillota bacterium]
MITSFEPIVNKDCKVLILGTMPGAMSLEKKQYYGNKRNQFWKIIYGLFNKEVEEDYEDRKRFLLNQQIAIWDVLKSCYREGSSDSKIINPIPNDFEAFFIEYPNIKKVYFNGKKAEEFFIKMAKGEKYLKEGLMFYRLPSTSPANAIRFKDKLEQWKAIIS